MLTEKDVADWETIRKPFLKLKEEVMKNSCGKCLWSDTTSGIILCSRDCPRKGNENANKSW